MSCSATTPLYFINSNFKATACPCSVKHIFHVFWYPLPYTPYCTHWFTIIISLSLLFPILAYPHNSPFRHIHFICCIICNPNMFLLHWSHYSTWNKNLQYGKPGSSIQLPFGSPLMVTGIFVIGACLMTFYTVNRFHRIKRYLHSSHILKATWHHFLIYSHHAIPYIQNHLKHFYCIQPNDTFTRNMTQKLYSSLKYPHLYFHIMNYVAIS